MAPDVELMLAGDGLRITPEEFGQVQRLARDVFGLELKDGKQALVTARLSRRLRALGLHDVSRYLKHIQSDTSGMELLNLVDALTTNFTSFRREPAHFELLTSRIVPALPSHAEIRIWSAGCSTGEEPYGILFELLAALGAAAAPRIKIRATDISTRVLEQARRGVYPMEKLNEMPPSWRQFLEKGSGEWEGYFRVAAAWKKLIEFGRLNLMEPLDREPLYDVIFCRNVMIYFDRPTQEDLVNRLTGRLAPGGWLLIGHSEGLSGLNSGLKYVQPATYRKPGASGGE